MSGKLNVSIEDMERLLPKKRETKMSKLVRNPEIKNCGTCHYHCYDEEDTIKGSIHCAINAFKTVAKDHIDKDCPLADVEIIEDISSVTLRYWKDCMIDLPDKDEIEKIIIVKRKKA